ncbi:MAG: magnesium transporter, partial [Planctomycetes bacterium]|nr:magnesium transporter [Planctomycetota bacterium]
MGERSRLVEALQAELDRARESGASAPLARIPELVEDDLIDLADLLDEFDDAEQWLIFDSLATGAQVTVLEEASEKVQHHLVDHLKETGRLPAVFAEMALDDVVDIVDEKTEVEREELLQGVDEARAEQIRELVQYQPDTAGGLMTAEFLAVSKETTVQAVKDLIRTRDDFESINNIFVVDTERLLGVFSSRQLILADNADAVQTFMTTDVIHVEVDDDPEEVYRAMETYHLYSLPVVDRFHDLVGIITVDDVLTLGEEEASEDVFRMAGSTDLHPTRDSILGRVRRRLPFLLLSLLGGFGTAAILRMFGVGENAVVTEVTYFMPLIVSLCGNIATQSSATMVRGFATGEVDAGRLGGVIIDEIGVGAVVGAICAVLSAGLAFLLGHNEPVRMALVVLCSIMSL